MMLDKELLVSDDQTLAITHSTPTLSDYSVDMGAAGTVPGFYVPAGTVQYAPKDPGAGKPVQILCQITDALTSEGSATLTVELVTADNAALSSNLVVLHSTPAIAKATCVAGYNFLIGGTLPPGIGDRYVGLRYTVGTASGTAGTITAGLVCDRQTAFV